MQFNTLVDPKARSKTGCAVVGNARDGGRIPALSRRVDPGQTTVVAGVPLEVLERAPVLDHDGSSRRPHLDVQ